MSGRNATPVVLAVAAALVGATAGEAAAPVKKGLYEGPAKGSNSRADKKTVQLKVSSNGKTLKFRGPHEDCSEGEGFQPSRYFFPRIDKVKISSSGRFKAKREYTDTSRASIVFAWTVKLSGRFKTARKAKGTVVYELVHHYQNRAPKPGRCGVRHVTFTATHVE
jgi:hypothetical protein